MIVLLTYYLILVLYAVIVLLIPGIGFARLLSQKPTTSNNQSISILIPFRNEAEYIKELCKSINRLDYPKDQFEVIFIDDDSSDQSLSILDHIDRSIDFEIIQNPKHLGKKASILKGVQQAKYDYIITSDADCSFPKELLQEINTTADLSIGITLKTAKTSNVIENIQEVESLMLAAITLGSAKMEIPMLSSGANLAYKKATIEDTQPYQDNLDINSGDDMFLLKSSLEHGLNVAPRIGKAVTTTCETSWDKYIEQGARWSGKNNRVGLPQTTLSAWLVLLANIVLPLSLITHFSSGWIILFIKFVVDFLFLFLSATYYERYRALLFAPVVFCFYPAHLIRVAIKIANNKKRN